MKPVRSFAIVLLAIALLTSACVPLPPLIVTPTPPATGSSRSLDPSLSWYADNRQRLDAMIATLGSGAAGYDPRHKPVATFDWDNSVIKNDIGAATLYWLVPHEKVLQPPDANWKVIPYLTDTAAAALRSACGASTPPGAPLPTATNQACAEALLALERTTIDGQPAFAGYNPRMYEPGSAWESHVLAGYTPAEIRAIAEQVITANLAAPVGATQVIGASEVPAYIRLYDQVRDLVTALQASGFDVWVVSASNQFIVEPFAARLNIPADHVIGVRSLLDAQGRLTTSFAGCGTEADGANTLFTHSIGKRCWINKVIYGDATPTAMQLRPAGSRPVFAMGDSDTDAVMVPDATALHLVINRNKPELMCNAYQNLDGRWLINPMFIAPKGPQAAAYPCATTACRDAADRQVPCRDAAGAVIPDQRDTVHGPG